MSAGSEIGSGPDFKIDWSLASGPRGYYEKSKRLIRAVLGVLDSEGALDGTYPMTMRAVFYKLVKSDLIENTDRKYDDLCDAISKARRDGIIPFHAITDRTRFLREDTTHESIGDALDYGVKNFAIDLWESQPERFEVWVEKDALLGYVEQACDPLRVPYISTRGYASDDAAKEAAERTKQCKRWLTVLHLADHDPSGVDMTRDLEERLDFFEAECDVERIGLNPDQIAAMNQPPNLAKRTDTRTKKYFDAFPEYRDGDRVKCWELDALDRDVFVETLKSRIKSAMKADEWNAALEREKEMREQMQKFVAVWHARQDPAAAAQKLVATFGREWCDELARMLLEPGE